MNPDRLRAEAKILTMQSDTLRQTIREFAKKVNEIDAKVIELTITANVIEWANQPETDDD